LFKEEFLHNFVKEAFRVVTPEVNDNKQFVDKRAKILEEIEEFNCLLELQELLIERLEIKLRVLK